MSDPLLPYYQQELAFIRNEAADFAKRNRQIARSLGIGPQGVAEDPHVSRLIESFAYLNARIRHKLDDDFPELTDAMLSVLYPHYQRPLPSMGVVQFVLDESQGELTTGYRLERGRQLETLDTVDGEQCRFRTCYPVTLWPFKVADEHLTGPPFSAPRRERSSAGRAPIKVEAVLRLALRCYSASVGFAKLPLDRLRFFLDGQEQHTYALYELLLNDSVDVALGSAAGDVAPVWLSRDAIQPVGFADEEMMLPYDARSFPGYCLMSEYFGFPQKFLFFDLVGLGPRQLKSFGRELELFVYLRRIVPDLVHNVTSDTFKLGCAPIINLFEQPADPILLTHTDYEYRVVPDRRRPKALEIYSIDRVEATSPYEEKVAYQPFYSFKHAVDREQQQTFWHTVRRAASSGENGASQGDLDTGTEVLMSLVDLRFRPSVPAEWTVHVATTCFNRDLPRHLHEPRFQLLEGAPVSTISSRAGPTQTWRPKLKHGAMWRLISHLSLNHLSLTDDQEGADALREILMLYDCKESPENRNLIDGIRRLESQRSVARVSGAPSGVCRGNKLKIHLDEQRYIAGGAYLFGAVLSHFLSLYSSLNSFVELVLTTEGREQRGEGPLATWKPRTGNRPLL